MDDKDPRKLINEFDIYLVFSNYLNGMLGYKENELYEAKEKSFYKVDLFGNNHTLFIYTNIIEESYVSNVKTQLLRIFPMVKYNDDKDMRSLTFNPILFRPLRLNKFDSITINIRDSSGNFVIFESGTVTLTLMFKKINN